MSKPVVILHGFLETVRRPFASSKRAGALKKWHFHPFGVLRAGWIWFIMGGVQQGKII